MAGIVSATAAQVATARVAVAKLALELEQIANGPLPPAAKLSTQQATRVDAKVDAVVAALAPLNT